MNSHILDTLDKREEEQYSHIIERLRSRAWVRRYIETGNLSEFFKGEENAENGIGKEVRRFDK